MIKYNNNLLSHNGNIITLTQTLEVTKSGYGALYNWYVTQESELISGFIVPTNEQWTDLGNTLGGESIAGGKLKSIRTDPDIEPRWDNPNTGATDEVNFSGIPGGWRNTSGNFFSLNIWCNWWTTTEISGTFAHYIDLGHDYELLAKDVINKPYGLSIRCIRNLVGGETTLSDGTFLTPVQDYDGNWYEVVKIGDFAWLAQNLRTEHYANGTPIPIITDNGDWGSTTDAAMCYFNNDIEMPGIVYSDEFITINI